MNNTKYVCLLLGLAFSVQSTPIFAAPKLGEAAPLFSGVGSNNEKVSLSEFRGKVIVLEWTNHGCPYVRRHYKSGNMQKLQKRVSEMGGVWLSVISSAPGKQGHLSNEKANELTSSRKALPAHVIIDVEGVIGKAYEARTTPHMFIVDKDGILVYMGGIDDDPAPRGKMNKDTKHYVREALDAINDGKEIANGATKPYGCSVKYAPTKI